jgi:hypothetical protein
MRALVLASALLAAAPALAQTGQLPLTSRSERQVDDINRSLQGQQRGLGQGQQNQFEINQLRGEIQRGQQFPSLTGPGARPGCPAGSIGC